MQSVKLSRLKSQLNALAVHFSEPELFQGAATSLFEMYENKRISTNQWSGRTQLSFYGIPESVMAELETKFAALSREFPQEAIANADFLWTAPYYEPKKIAIVILSKLDAAYVNEFIKRIQSWISPALEDILVTDLISSINDKTEISHSKEWLLMVKTLLDSHEPKSVELGLISLKATLSQPFQNLPGIFSLVTPILQNPNRASQKELVDVIKALINQSEAETASFLLMIAEIYPGDNTLKTMRKFIPLFDKYYQNELRSTLSKK